MLQGHIIAGYRNPIIVQPSNTLCVRLTHERMNACTRTYAHTHRPLNFNLICAAAEAA